MSEQSGGDRSLIAKEAGCHCSDDLHDRRPQTVGAIERRRTTTEGIKRRLEAEYSVRSLDKRAREIAEASKGEIDLMAAYRLAVDEEIGRLKG